MLLAAQGGDARVRVKHFRHTRGAARALVADDDHIVVVEYLRSVLQSVEQVGLAVEDSSLAGENVVLKSAFDTG